MADTRLPAFRSPGGYDPGIPTRRGYVMPRDQVAESGTGRVGPHTIGADPSDIPTAAVRPPGSRSPSERLWDQEG